MRHIIRAAIAAAAAAAIAAAVLAAAAPGVHGPATGTHHGSTSVRALADSPGMHYHE